MQENPPCLDLSLPQVKVKIHGLNILPLNIHK